MIRPLILLVLAALLTPSPAQTDEPPDACLVNINKASVQEFEKVPGIGRARAEMIVRIRQKNGPFRQVEELRALPRLSEKTLRAVKKLLSVSPCKAGPGAAGGKARRGSRRIKSDE